MIGDSGACIYSFMMSMLQEFLDSPREKRKQWIFILRGFEKRR